MKLDYKINIIFQEMSPTELETLHHLCDFEQTKILQSLALAVLKNTICRIPIIKQFIKLHRL